MTTILSLEERRQINKENLLAEAEAKFDTLQEVDNETPKATSTSFEPKIQEFRVYFSYCL